MNKLEALVPRGVGRVLLTIESDTGLAAEDVATLGWVIEFLLESLGDMLELWCGIIESSVARGLQNLSSSSAVFSPAGCGRSVRSELLLGVVTMCGGGSMGVLISASVECDSVRLVPV